MYTFGLVYVMHGEEFVEEIDVVAPNEEQALKKATAEAKADYADGWVRIEPMSAGGSGGLVQW